MICYWDMAALLDIFNINIFKKPLVDLRHPKTLVLNFDLKLCPYRNLIESNFHKIFQKFWTRSLSIMQLSRYTPIFTFLNTPYLKETFSKLLKYFMEASLDKISIWTNFQVKIQNEGFWMPEVHQRLLENVYIKNI